MPIATVDGYYYSEIIGDYAYFKNTVSTTITKEDFILENIGK